MATSCSVDDPEVILIENAVLQDVIPPDELVFGEVAIFQVVYFTPTNCHRFERYDIVEEGQTISIRTETRFDSGRDCQETPGLTETEPFEFLIDNTEDYTFRFLAGASDSGQLQFITFSDLPVVTE